MPGIGDVTAGRRPGRADRRPRRRGCATATCSWSPARSCPRRRAGWSTCRRTARSGTPPGRRCWPPRPPGWWPRRGQTRIVQTHHGFVMASAGIDASNVDTTRLVLLPEGPGRVGPGAARRAARAVRPGRRGDHQRHDGPALAQRPHRRGPRRGRHRRRCATTGARSTRTATSCSSPRWRWSTSWPARGELVKGKCDQVPVAVVRGYLDRGPGRTTAIGARRRWSGTPSTTCSRWAPPRRRPPGCARPPPWPTAPARRRPTRRAVRRADRRGRRRGRARHGLHPGHRRGGTRRPGRHACPGWPAAGDGAGARCPGRPRPTGRTWSASAPTCNGSAPPWPPRVSPPLLLPPPAGHHRQRRAGPLTAPAESQPPARDRRRHRTGSGVEHGPAERGQGVQHGVAVAAG